MGTEKLAAILAERDAAIRRRDFARAREIELALIEANPRDHGAHLKAAWTALALGDPNLAISHYQAAVALAPTPVTYRGLARAYRAAGDHDRAAEATALETAAVESAALEAAAAARESAAREAAAVEATALAAAVAAAAESKRVARTCFFTCCTEDYELYAALHAFLTLAHNPDSVVEIGVQSAAGYGIRHADSIRLIRKFFGEQAFVIRDARFTGILANTVRFVTQPFSRADYVYIGDIDILTLRRDITSLHIDHMARTGLKFSNAQRAVPDGTPPRLTGLHFSAWVDMYPTADVSDLDLVAENDEHVLLELMVRRGYSIPEPRDIYRPVHGIHISPNRPPFGAVVRGQQIPGWGLDAWKQSYAEIRKDTRFIELLETLNGEEVALIQIIDALYKASAK